jgi:hypothetical protein
LVWCTARDQARRPAPGWRGGSLGMGSRESPCSAVALLAGGRRASRHSHSSAMSLDRLRATRRYPASPSATCVKTGCRRASD